MPEKRRGTVCAGEKKEKIRNWWGEENESNERKESGNRMKERRENMR